MLLKTSLGVAQSVRHLWLDLSSLHDPTVRWSPASGSRWQCEDSLGFTLPLKINQKTKKIQVCWKIHNCNIMLLGVPLHWAPGWTLPSLLSVHWDSWAISTALWPSQGCDSFWRARLPFHLPVSSSLGYGCSSVAPPSHPVGRLCPGPMRGQQQHDLA